jgi:hypothetical protein
VKATGVEVNATVQQRPLSTDKGVLSFPVQPHPNNNVTDALAPQAKLDQDVGGIWMHKVHADLNRD